MTKSSSPRRLPLLSFSLALLLAGVACSHASEGEQAAAKAPAQTKPAAAPAQSGSTAAAPAAPAAPAAAAPAPGAPAGAAANATITPDKLPAVVAKVNGQDIKKAELLKEADGLKSQIGGATLPAALPQSFYRQVLDGLIAKQLLMADAKAQGIVVTDAEVKQQVDQLKSRFPSPAEFNKALAAQGLTEATLADTAREQLTVQKYVETKVMANVPPASDAAVKSFYDQNLDKMKQPERRHLRHILVKADKDTSAADKAKAKAKADNLLAQLKKGGDFAALAKANSDDPGSKENGGDLNWVQKGQTVPTFEQAAWALKTKNEISPVVESPFGYHIIQLLDVQEARTMPYEEVKGRIGDFLKQKQSSDQVKAKIQDLRNKAKVEVFI
jgi:peptidyl-prolyl cis-trans isomerase C